MLNRLFWTRYCYTVFINRTMESGYPLGKLTLSQNALTHRTGGTAVNTSRVVYPRDVKIRTCDHGTLDFFIYFLKF